MTVGDTFLPTLFKVLRYSFDPDATNDLGNDVEKWEEPTEHAVYGWGPPQLTTPKEVIVGSNRYVVELELLVPPGFFAKDRDRIRLGSIEQVEAAEDAYPWFKVVGPIEDYTHNPFGWNPGSVVNLVEVSGAR